MTDHSYVNVSDTIRVARTSGNIHISLSIAGRDGEFLSSGLILTPAQARAVADALVQMADAHNSAAVPA